MTGTTELDEAAIDALDAQVTAEPDAQTRARLLGLDLATLDAIRMRMLLGFWVIALGFLCALGAPTVIAILAATGTSESNWIPLFVVHEVLGGLSMLVAMWGIGFLINAIATRASPDPNRRILVTSMGSAIGLPVAFALLALMHADNPPELIGAAAFAPAVLLFNMQTIDLAWAIRLNLPGTARVVAAVRSAGSQAGWTVTQYFASCLSVSGSMLLIGSMWWAFAPVAAASVGVVLLMRRVERTMGGRQAIVLQLCFNIVLFTAGILAGGGMLTPEVTFAPPPSGPVLNA